ncbi:putative secreted protein [Candidatus Sulfopaludibacter sp. SbA4]|nr:putative secreted protein [Candidatus Sulfopaludibacter sp. SbA4]
MPALDNDSHAIVIGGSMGGLLAARVLADRYQQVTILERDEFPAIGEHRRGVPQGRHTHGLLASGRDVLERLFPGISNDLIAAGAIAGDIVQNARWCNEGGLLARFQSGLNGLLMTRPLLEGTVRHRVLALSNVVARQGFHVEALTVSEDRKRVTGVKDKGTELHADLVIDTTGRGSSSPQWLEAIGYPKPVEERVEVALAYTTRFFRRHRSQLNGDVVVIVPPTPQGKRGGVMLAQEGDRWTVTLIGHFGQAAPTDVPGFVEYARTLPAPYIHEVVRESEPVSEPMTARFPASMRRRYERLERFPEGFLVFGDAISSFNPIYGQGMSVAALEAMELQAVLAESSGNLARRFFRRAAKVVDMPWSVSVGNDLRMPETVGPRNAGVSFINWYMVKLNKAAQKDPVPAMAFFRVANLLAPPPSVMHPKVVWRVLIANLRRPLPDGRGSDQSRDRKER